MSAVVSTSSVNAATRIEELGRIIMAYSEVTDKLQQSHERLERTVESLREELGEKNRLLERKNRLAALGEMAAGMAHEIRNPLGGIQLYASMLAKDVGDRPASLEIVKKISAGVKRLEGLVSQVLQFTREIRANVGEVDLAGVVGQAVELAGATFEKCGVACDVGGPSEMIVLADGLLLGQAVLNLVMNAAEAMRGCGKTCRVRFGGADEAKQVRQFWVVVEDEGPGISREIWERVFNPFFTTKETGTGLGLAIVHRIVEAHDGTITVSNREEGGARFEIRV